MPLPISFSARGLLLWVGLLLMWGAVALTAFLYFLFIVSVPVFLLGLVLVLKSGQPAWLKALAVAFAFAAVAWTNARVRAQGPHEQPTTFLIPEGFEGPVLLIRNEPCAPLPQRENGRVIYHVPANGVLITRDTVPNRNHPYYSWPHKGYYQLPDNKYYVVDRRGRPLRELTELHGARALGDNPKEPGTLFSDGLDELAVFYKTPQESGINAPAAGFAYQYLVITTPNRFDTNYQLPARRRLHALADQLLPRCRVPSGQPAQKPTP